MSHRVLFLFSFIAMYSGMVESPVRATGEKPHTVQTTVQANILSYVEEPYTLQMGAHYDTRKLKVPPRPTAAMPRARRLPEAKRTLESSFDVVVSSTLPVPDTDLAVGPNHLIAVNSDGVFAYLKDGTNLLNDSLSGFFMNLAPIDAPLDPRVLYDEFWDRWVVLAIDVSGTTSDLLLAVSVDGSPMGPYHQVKIGTLLPNHDPDGPGPRPAEPHRAEFPKVGIEKRQIYVTFEMLAVSNNALGGTTVWNISKWAQTDPTPLGGFYDGQTVTLQAGVRPFSMGDDYDNERTLTPVEIHGEIVGSPVDRGIFLAAYGGVEIDTRSTEALGTSQALQIFWITSVGPTVSKMVVPMGSVDDVSGFSELPEAPQRNTPLTIDTGDRLIYDGVWRAGAMWLVTTVVPPAGVDAAEATAHWVLLNAPNPSTLSLSEQGDISGDTLVSGAHTYYPSLDVSAGGRVAVGFSVSAPELELSSAVAFLGSVCNTPDVEVQPSLLRRGTAVRAGAQWGRHSGIDWDFGECFWVHNAHPVSGAPDSWAGTVGEFCFDPAFIFGDGFESGTLAGWCQ